jgi:hypothetical protein
MASENAQCGELRSISAPFNLKRTVSNIQCTASVSQLALVNSSSRQNLLFVFFFFFFPFFAIFFLSFFLFYQTVRVSDLTAEVCGRDDA